VREIVPYKTFNGALNALDNGGRFFNLFTKTDDQKVETSEIARAAGVFSADMRAFVFFEMALTDLSPDGRRRLISHFSPDLMERYQTFRPLVVRPSLVESTGAAGRPAIVTGYPVFVENKSQFRGFIVMVTPVIMLIPITDVFDVYEVFDSPDMSVPKTVIATTRGSKRLDTIYSRFGGILKELEFDDKTGKRHSLYLESLYYTPVPIE
jgi:hypothetical protein